MKEKVEEFIKENCNRKDLCYYYQQYPKEIQEMLKNIYLCCFRFGLYKAQTIFMLNESLKSFNSGDIDNDLVDLLG